LFITKTSNLEVEFDALHIGNILSMLDTRMMHVGLDSGFKSPDEEEERFQFWPIEIYMGSLKYKTFVQVSLVSPV
jgi:hypothetical protein